MQESKRRPAVLLVARLKDSCVFPATYPVTQVDGEDGLLPLLQEENDHEGKGV